MLGVLCARTPKPWILSSLSSTFLHHHHHYHHGSTAAALGHHHHFLQRLVGNPIQPDDRRRRCFHIGAGGAVEPECLAGAGGRGGVISVWHAIVPVAGIDGDAGAGGSFTDWRRDYLLPAFLRQQQYQKKKAGGEGSWNVAWDARPARWIHRLDLAWLLFGVCAFLSPAVDWSGLVNNDVGVVMKDNNGEKEEEEKLEECQSRVGGEKISEEEDESSAKYRVTGIPADGRCLFRAIAHGSCLRSGEEAPDENRQRELADELRAKVVNELLKRREETEWFIEGDFDSYVKRIRQPFVWGGEPELLMASHVLKTPIAVYLRDKSSGDLTEIAKYGEEYQKEKELPINVLFHGYGHYDSLETYTIERCQTLKATS